MQVDFFINTGEGFIKFNSQDIHYIQSFGKKSKVTTTLGSFIISSTLGKLEREVLPSGVFCRVHRSYIVSLETINAFDLDNVQVNGVKIPFEKAYRGRLLSSVRIIW